jgi:O-succinylbenzoate synthase
MKVIAINHRENKVYFKSPYNVDGLHNLDYKYSDLINLSIKRGHETINLVGEISYLPHFHDHSYQEILKSLTELKSRLPLAIDEIATSTMPSTLRFAIEGALYKLDHQVSSLHPVKTNSLYSLDQEDQSAFNLPIVKLKIARKNADEEIPQIKKILNDYPKLKLRLDANRKLTPQTIKPYLELDLLRVEYFEEPFQKLDDYKELSSFPLALDENALAYIASGIHFTNLRALVLKPSCYGIKQTITMVEFSNKKNLKTIFSSTFESSVGLEIINAIANQYAPDDFHGLETSAFLK